MYRHKISTASECTLNHELGQGRHDRREHMASAKHGLANGHEVSHGMIAIANELYLRLSSDGASVLIDSTS